MVVADVRAHLYDSVSYEPAMLTGIACVGVAHAAAFLAGRQAG